MSIGSVKRRQLREQLDLKEFLSLARVVPVIEWVAQHIRDFPRVVVEKVQRLRDHLAGGHTSLSRHVKRERGVLHGMPEVPQSPRLVTVGPVIKRMPDLVGRPLLDNLAATSIVLEEVS